MDDADAVGFHSEGTDSLSVAEIERHIKDAGFTPQRRNMLYEPIETPETDRFGRPPRQRAVVSEGVAS